MKEMKKRIGDMLVEMGQITQSQLNEALRRQKISGKRLGEILIDDGLINEDDMISLLEIQLDIKRIYLEEVNAEEKAYSLIPESLARKYSLIPIDIVDNKILVVMNDPLNIFAIDDVKIASGYEVEPSISSKEEIDKAIAKYYAGQGVQKAAEELQQEHLSKDKKENEKEKEKEMKALDEIKNAPVVKLVDTIIANAVRARASDIHIEPFETHLRVRYRVDGELQEVLKAPKETAPALITRIKILANLNIAEKRIPQDGRILTAVDENSIDLRVSVLPTIHGEKTVIRILKRDSFLVGKEQLGLEKDDMEKLDRIIKSPHGIILVTGPTGSGKSTTLYTILSDLNSPDKNIVTVEDPVEYMLEGINQVNVNVKAGLTFAAGLRSILRQDPDIIMIGEIRDGETAEIAVRAAITGHLVLSTIHTNDAPSTVTRLVDMGIEPYLVSTSLSGVVAQRLVRKICPYCKIEYEASEHEKHILGIEKGANLKLFKGQGCVNCNNSGYRGRMGVFEIMEIDRDIREKIINSNDVDQINEAAKINGMKTLQDYCRNLVNRGDTTIDELIKIAFLKD